MWRWQAISLLCNVVHVNEWMIEHWLAITHRSTIIWLQRRRRMQSNAGKYDPSTANCYCWRLHGTIETVVGHDDQMVCNNSYFTRHSACRPKWSNLPRDTWTLLDFAVSRARCISRALNIVPSLFQQQFWQVLTDFSVFHIFTNNSQILHRFWIEYVTWV